MNELLIGFEKKAATRYGKELAKKIIDRIPELAGGAKTVKQLSREGSGAKTMYQGGIRRQRAAVGNTPVWRPSADAPIKEKMKYVKEHLEDLTSSPTMKQKKETIRELQKPYYPYSSQRGQLQQAFDDVDFYGKMLDATRKSKSQAGKSTATIGKAPQSDKKWGLRDTLAAAGVGAGSVGIYRHLKKDKGKEFDAQEAEARALATKKKDQAKAKEKKTEKKSEIEKISHLDVFTDRLIRMIS